MAGDVKRATAVKLRISDILSASFTKGVGWQPSFITVENLEVSRVNVMATVIGKNQPQLIVLDDGTGSVSVRSFDSHISNVDVGDLVQLIAKPREYSDERYLVPETIRKVVDYRWFLCRKLELSQKIYEKPNLNIQTTALLYKDETLLIQNMIRNMDEGEGAPYGEIISKINNPNAERILENLLREGEIFEIKPGRLKLL